MQAAKDLENNCRIRTNLYLVMGDFTQAKACAEAGAAVISIPVGLVSGSDFLI